MAQDLVFIFFVWFLSLILQLISAPLLFSIFKDKTADFGWGFGRIIIWLLMGLLIWFLAHLKLPFNNSIFIWFLVLVGSITSFSFWQKLDLLEKIKKIKKIILTEEAIFLFGLLTLSLIRTYHPNILDLEKFMDAGLINSYLKSPTLPVIDIWLAGEKINYYSFGHFLASVITSFWGLEIRYAYNLLLGLVCGLVLMQSFSLVINLVFNFNQKIKNKNLIKSGLLGSLLVGVAGNSHAFWFFVTEKSLKTYWYPDATRFIKNTIHEFPAYSFIVSDLHAHVLSMPIVLLLGFVILFWLHSFLKQRKSGLWAVGVGVLLGILIMTSTWDMMIYSLLLGVLGIFLLFINFKLIKSLALSALVIIVTSLVTASAFLLNFKVIPQGIKVVTEQSPIMHWLTLWSGHLIGTSIFFIFAFVLLRKIWLAKDFHKIIKLPKFASLLLLICLTLTAWALLILPEMIYVKDIYPNHPRANTMFKLTFQSFMMMGIIIASFTGILKNKLLKLFLFLITLSLIIYPFFGFRDYYQRFRQRKSLDGMSWLQSAYPDDYAGIIWLQKNQKQQVNIIEAVGESYTDYARVSTFTGLPTVLGWRVHEWLWRGGFDIPKAKTAEVKMVYEQPSSRAVYRILEKYNIKYIFIGTKEYEAYRKLDLENLKNLGETVFEQNQTLIIRLE
jgi:uncharacterized membrane protein